MRRADNVEGKINYGRISGERIAAEGDALDACLAPTAADGRQVVGEEDKIAVLRIGADGGCAVALQQAAAKLGQGDGAVAVLIRAEAARAGERIRQRAGEVPRARQPLAADFARPVPAFLLAAGRADDIVIIARKQVLERLLHALANHCAGVACVQQQHFFAGNRVEHAAQLIRRNALFGFAVGEQERHQPVHGGVPQPVGADVEVADVVRVRIGECFANEGNQRGRGRQPVFAGDDGLHVKRAAG